MIILGPTLKRLRADKGWSMTHLSEISKVQLATLSRIENNKMVGSIDTQAAIARAFGYKLSEFFAEVERNEGKD